MSLVMRVDGDPSSIIGPLHSAIHDIDPTVPFKAPLTMTDVVAETLVFERMESWLFGIFAALALALAMIGMYALVSHEVEQSTRDIGVRVALGASRGRIFAMVVARVAWMLGAGVAAGILLTLAARKLIGMVIYIDARKDAGEFAAIALLLVAAGMLSALFPASRAASIEPMQALRTE
jgi:ABC-type antimicrobial peptide transport system permease subunit